MAVLLAGVVVLSLLTNSETHAQTLSTPTLSATAVEGGAIVLGWNAVSGAARYDLWAWTSAGGWNRLDDGTLTGASYRHTGLTAGTKYWYTIRAVATDGTVSDWSAYATATALSAATFTPTVTAVPGAATPTVTPTALALSVPTLTATLSGTNAVELNWNAVAGAVRYILWAWTSADGWEQLDDGSLTGTSYTHGGLTLGTTYWYAVRALAADGTEGDWSEYPSITVSATQGPTATATPTGTPTSAVVAADKAALVALYQATDGANWTNSDNWLSAEPLSSWYGVTTDESGRVNELILSRNKLLGTIPDLSALTKLENLYLDDNGLSGSIPDLDSFINMRELYLWGNELTGSIPDLSALTNLTRLYLGDNRLSGSVPELGTLTNLTQLYLYDNRLSGPIPVLTALSNLEALDLSGNQFCLPAGESLSHPHSVVAAHLLSLNLPACAASVTRASTSTPTVTPTSTLSTTFTPSSTPTLTATATPTATPTPTATTAPDAAAERAALVALYQATDGANWTNNNNWLSTDPLSTWYGVTTDAGDHVTELTLSRNNLSGPIPDLSALTNLQNLYLDDNGLSGPIPDLGAFINLRELYLWGNVLTGSIPDLSALTNLTRMYLGDNQLNGSVPELGALTNLTQLYINNNQLSGPIPILTALTALNALDLSGNQFCLPAGESLSHSYSVVLAHLQSLNLPACTESVTRAPTLTSTPTSTSTPTLTPTTSPTSSLTSTPTSTFTPTSTPTSGPTLTPTPTATATATVSTLSAPVLVAASTGTNAFDLSWTALAGAARYVLWTKVIDVSEWQRIDDGALTGTTFRHGGLLPGASYRYAVRAIDANGQWLGAWSNYPMVMVPESGAETSTTTATPTVSPTPTITPTPSITPTAATSERGALVALYQATDGANWTHNDNWLNDQPLSTWYGVFVDDSGQVVRVVLERNGLNGSVPDLSALTNLTRLDLARNELTGQIPNLGALTKLENLDLSFNELSGQIPDVSALTNLNRLELGNNALSGQIPDLSALTKLTRLELSSNALSGQIPDLSALTNLWWLLLSGNNFSGPFPDLSALTNLGVLALGNNEFSGPFPDLNALTNLRWLYLNDNRFSGPIPDLGALTNLTWLYLDNNQLSGQIPDLSALTNLTILGLDSNQLTGQIPDLSALTNLENLNLASNQLTGQIPEMDALIKLTSLKLESNNLDGSIPDLSALTELATLNLSDNQLTGPVLNLHHLTSLWSLHLRNNQLRGPFPDLSNLGRLKGLRLDGNSLCRPQGFSLSGSNAVVAAHLNSLSLPTCTSADTMLTPAVPPNLQATVGSGEVALTWDAVSNAAGYELRAWDSFDSAWGSIGGVLTSTTYTHTVQTDGRNYYYQVRAGDANDVYSAWSDRVYAAVVPSAFSPPPASFGLDLSFQKHFIVDGVVVVAQGVVSDTQMVQSRAIITGMLTNRSELLTTMAENNTRIYLESDRNGGISNKNPGMWSTYLTSQDPNCDTFIHEFGHLVHYAIEEQTNGEQFNTRLTSLYQDALAAGLWTGLYASSNAREYWAETVQFWFQETMPSPLNATYAKLEDYDPEAAKLVEEVFGDTATVPAGCKP